MTAVDAVVIGAGHNGLAAAVILARAGWRVVVVERNSEPGGAVRTEQVTLPGFSHDLFAMNLNLFMGSAFHAEFADDLARHGFEPVVSSRPFASVFPDGSHVGVTTDRDETLAGIRAVAPDDAEAWLEAEARFNEVAPHLFPLLGVRLPSAAAAAALWRGSRALGMRWMLELGRLVVQSPREFVEERFTSREVQAMCAAWGMHLDFSPDIPGGALFPFLETFASAGNGMTLGRGGAASMIRALVAMLHAAGGELRTGTAASRVVIEDGRAAAVVLDDGERIDAAKAVIANLVPPVLFGRLVEERALPATFMRKVGDYRAGPATMMIHLAMDDLPDWRAAAAGDFSYVHIGPYMEDMSLAYQQATAGMLPARPTLVVGQPTVSDPSRAPEGKHVLWIQVRMVPAHIGGDAAGEISATSWDEAKEAMADRVLAIVDEYAPGIDRRVLGRAVYSPADLEHANPNLIGGDSLGGSHHLMQHFFLRPFPGWTRYRTPVPGLYMCGSGTWPGAGVGAGSGYLLGKQLAHRPLLERLRSRR